MTILINEFKKNFTIFFKYLKLSLYSKQFYREVFYNFSGYGFRFIFTASLVAAVITSLFTLIYTSELKSYFLEDYTSSRTKVIEHIFNQIPTIKFDGVKISIDDKEPYYIYNTKDKVVAIIDTKGEIKNPDLGYARFTAEKIIFTLDKSKNNKFNFEIEYRKFFETPGIFDHKDLKIIIGNYLSYMEKLIIFLFFPLITIIKFVSVILERALNIFLIYSFLNFLNRKTLMKSACRISMFGAGLPLILESLLLPLKFGYEILLILQLWMSFFAIYSVYSAEISKSNN